MKFSEGLLRTAPLLLVGWMLGGCLPSAPKDEEKEPYFLAGKSHVNSMDFNGAVESFEKAVEVNPKSAPAHFELGWLYDQKESNPAAAIYHYDRFLKLSPNSGKEDMVKTRILACKQQLAQTVSLGPITEKQTREIESLAAEKQSLAAENKRLKEELEKWRASASRQQPSASQSATAAPAARASQASVPGQAASPAASTPIPAESPRSAVAPAASSRTHIIKGGETLRVIARKYGVKVDALMAANPRLDPRRLRVGQALTIPAP